jgi:predicted phosphodiesterase
MKMNSGFLIKISILPILLLLIIMPISGLSSGATTTYSIVHISDTQNLASRFPETYDYTFSYLDSIKTRYNISAIILTGDLVNTWNSKTEWNAYSHAIRTTSIPIYVIAGNHDTNEGGNYQYFTQNTGNTKNSHVTRLENFDLVGINYVDNSLEPQEFAALRKTLVSAPENFTIIATHFYMDINGTLSPLGTDIEQQLIVKPTIVMAGHIHADFVRDRVIGQYPVIEDLTNYQDGIANGSPSENVSAGTFYTVTTRKGQVEKISAKIIWISPRHSFDSEHVFYDISVQEPDNEPSLAEITPDCSSIPGSCGVPTITTIDGIWNSIWESLKRLFRFS